MKENYIRRVKRAFLVSKAKKGELVRDLREVFASALEHGETEAQVIGRLGSPQSFADSVQEQLGINCAQKRKKRDRFRIGVSFAATIAASAIGILLRSLRVPENVIGQADAMTSIRVNGAVADISALLLLLGVSALIAAAILIVRYAVRNRIDRRG